MLYLYSDNNNILTLKNDKKKRIARQNEAFKSSKDRRLSNNFPAVLR